MAIEDTPQSFKHPLSGAPKMYPKYYTALFELEPFEVPDRINEIGAENNLLKKEEHHLTLVGFRVGREIKRILDTLEQDAQEEKLAAYNSLVESFQASPQVNFDELFLIKKTYESQPGPDDIALPTHTRNALVALVDMPEMEAFYTSLNQIFGTEFDPTFPHVSLYTGSDHELFERLGIGIYSKEEFEEMEKTKVPL